MSYKVINPFKDKEDNDTLYQKGENYPKGDFKPTKKRLELLLTIHPTRQLTFIVEEKDPDEDNKKAEEKKVEKPKEKNSEKK